MIVRTERIDDITSGSDQEWIGYPAREGVTESRSGEGRTQPGQWYGPRNLIEVQREDVTRAD